MGYNLVIKLVRLWKILELTHFDSEDCKVRSEVVSGLILSEWLGNVGSRPSKASRRF